MLNPSMRALSVTLAALFLVGAAAPRAAIADDSKPTQDELQQLIDDTDTIAKTVSGIRGLPVKKRIARGILSREGIEKRLLQRIDLDYAPGELQAEAVALKRL